MKLYFYILETPYNGKPYIRFEECEVEEKPKTYKPIDKFPSGIYRSCVNKSDIGNFSGCGANCVILTEKDNLFAKNMFSDRLKGLIKSKNKEIERLTERLNAVYEFEE